MPDELWELTAPLSPKFTSRPHGGGTAPVDERVVFTAMVYVLTSGCAWRYPPDSFGVSPATAHRRFTVWTETGLWCRPHRAVLDELGARGELDWSSAIVDAASARAKGGSLTGPNPVDSGKKDSKPHVLSEAHGMPPAVAVSGGANVPDSQAFKPLIPGIPAVCSRRGPRRRKPVKVRADKAYCSAPRSTSAGSAAGTSSRGSPVRHRGRREPRPAPLEDRAVDRLALRLPPPHHPVRTKGSHFLAFLGLAAALTCDKRLAKLAT